MQRQLILASVLLAAAAAVRGSEPAPAGDATPAFDPTSAYVEESIEGWAVYFNRRLLEGDPELAGKTRTELARQLKAIVAVVPEKRVAALRRTKIWVERFHPKFPCACYHPSADWLRENGFNPDKVDSVDVSNPENFVACSREQPWMVLHELAHAYHDQTLSHNHRGVRRAFEQARKSGVYEQVRHADNRVVRHYALNNDQEYFAEATEAYFGKNDFAPFDRAELKEFDPAGFKLMVEVWGRPLDDPPAGDRR
jgi:hypothetical protein